MRDNCKHYNLSNIYHQADVAQLAEQLICNQQVNGSSPFISSIFLSKIKWENARVAKGGGL